MLPNVLRLSSDLNEIWYEAHWNMLSNGEFWKIRISQQKTLPCLEL